MGEKIKNIGNKLKKFWNNALNGFANAVVKKRICFTIAFASLFILGVVGFFFVKTNYDSTAYLPLDSEVKQGLSTMYAEFGDGGNASVMIIKYDGEEKKSITYSECISFKEKMLKKEGIASAMWLDDLFNPIMVGLSDEYTKAQYGEAFILALNILANNDFSTLADNPLFSSFDISNITSEQLTSLLNTDIVWDLLKQYIEKELAVHNYTFDYATARKVISEIAIGIMSSENLDFGNINLENMQEFIAGFSSSVSMFYASDENGNSSPLYQVTFTGTDYSDSTIKAIDGIRELAKEEGYDIHMSGNAATTYNSIDCVNKQTLYALIAVGVVVLIIMFLLSTSFWEPVLYLAAIGVAVVINMGSNVVMGSVSYLTSGVAGILQLALSMDYSIFLLTRFKQEKEKTTDIEQAMINAIKASLSPISASSLTTIASFVAIMFMSYTIGLDMGFVFAKGVVLSLLSVFMFLPGLVIYTNRWIEKSEHRSFKLTFKKFTKVILKARYVIPVVMLAVIVLAAVGQNYMQFGYGDTATFGSEGSLIYKDKKEIESVFGCQNQLAVLLKKEIGDREVTLEDGAVTCIETAIITELGKKEYVITAQSFSVIEESGMDVLLPESFLKQFYNGGDYTRMVTYLDLPEESENTERAITEIRGVFAKYGIEKGDYYLLGGSSSALEIKEIVNIDYTVITWVSIGLVIIILFLTFKNAILPFLLVFVIQGSVWISMSISVLTGDRLVFLGYLIVSTVMLGATIDYGILLTSNYLEARKTEDKSKAMTTAVSKSTRAILTSSIILCCAGFVIALTSSMPAIKVFGELVGRTAATSLVLVLVLLPCILVLFDKLIQKTSIGGTKYFKERKTHAETVTEETQDFEEVAAEEEKE